MKKIKPSTYEELLAAIDSLTDDEKNKIRDHIDESVAAQEVDEGERDEESAKDRIDESVGAEEEKVDEEEGEPEEPNEPEESDSESEGGEEEGEPEEPAEEEKPDESEDKLDRLFDLLTEQDARIAALEKALEERNERHEREPVGVDSDYSDEGAPVMPREYLEMARNRRS